MGILLRREGTLDVSLAARLTINDSPNLTQKHPDYPLENMKADLEIPLDYLNRTSPGIRASGAALL